MRGDTGDIDNTAASSIGHGRTELLAREQYAANKVEVEILQPIRQLNLLEWPLGGHGHLRIIAAGRVNQHRRCAEYLNDFLMSCTKALLPDSISRNENGLARFIL